MDLCRFPRRASRVPRGSVHSIVSDTSDIKKLQKIQGYFTLSFEKIIKTWLNSNHYKYTII